MIWLLLGSERQQSAWLCTVQTESAKRQHIRSRSYESKLITGHFKGNQPAEIGYITAKSWQIKKKQATFSCKEETHTYMQPHKSQKSSCCSCSQPWDSLTHCYDIIVILLPVCHFDNLYSLAYTQVLYIELNCESALPQIHWIKSACINKMDNSFERSVCPISIMPLSWVYLLLYPKESSISRL